MTGPAAARAAVAVTWSFLRQARSCWRSAARCCNRVGGKVDEVVWWESPGQRTNNGGGSTGGGVSVPNPRLVLADGADRLENRTAPTAVSFLMSPALAGPPFYDNLLDGQNFPGGGTSASTPVWASLIALMNAALPANKKQRFLPPLLASLPWRRRVSAMSYRAKTLRCPIPAKAIRQDRVSTR